MKYVFRKGNRVAGFLTVEAAKYVGGVQILHYPYSRFQQISWNDKELKLEFMK